MSEREGERKGGEEDGEGRKEGEGREGGRGERGVRERSEGGEREGEREGGRERRSDGGRERGRNRARGEQRERGSGCMMTPTWLWSSAARLRNVPAAWHCISGKSPSLAISSAQEELRTQ